MEDDMKLVDAVVEAFTEYRTKKIPDWEGTKSQKSAAWNYVYIRYPISKKYHQAFLNARNRNGRYQRLEDMSVEERIGKQLNDKVAGSLGGRNRKPQNGNSRQTVLGVQKAKRYQKIVDKFSVIASDEQLAIAMSVSLREVKRLRQELIDQGYRFNEVSHGFFEVTTRPFSNEQLAKELAQALSKDNDLREMLVDYLRDFKNGKK